MRESISIPHLSYFLIPRHSLISMYLTIIGLDAIEKKFGGGKVDPEKQRGMNEKITDGARSAFEKATG